MKLLLTGATGQLGNYAVEALLKKVKPEDIVVSVRNPEKAKHLALKGIEVRKGDFDDAESLQTAFKGIDRLAIISTDGDNATRIRQHLTAVKAAKEANVKLIVYTSVADAQNSTLGLAEVHRITEDAIFETGIPYVILRNNWYLENELSTIKAVIDGAPWVTSAGNGKVGWALKSDYAEAIAAVLASEGYDNKIFEVSNTPLTQAELAAAVGKVIGKTVSVLDVDDASYAEGLSKLGFPPFVVDLFTGIQKSIRENALDITSSDFEKILGRPVTPIEVAIKRLSETL